jgi:hypothetical protein
LLYRGRSSLPSRLKQQGWMHIGDLASSRGHGFGAYQGAEGGVHEDVRGHHPGWFDRAHQLDADEKYNNSSGAVSPDGQWMISGEWGVMSRLLMFPTPILNPATPQTGGALALAGLITLDRPLRDVQGATLSTPPDSCALRTIRASTCGPRPANCSRSTSTGPSPGRRRGPT